MIYLMLVILTLIMFGGFVGFIIGMIRPGLVLKWNIEKRRKWVALIYGSAFIISFFAIGIIGPPEESEMTKADKPISNPDIPKEFISEKRIPAKIVDNTNSTAALDAINLGIDIESLRIKLMKKGLFLRLWNDNGIDQKNWHTKADDDFIFSYYFKVDAVTFYDRVAILSFLITDTDDEILTSMVGEALVDLLYAINQDECVQRLVNEMLNVSRDRQLKFTTINCGGCVYDLSYLPGSNAIKISVADEKFDSLVFEID